jgi:hypothetical protein
MPRRSSEGYNKPEPLKVGDRIIITDRRGNGYDETKFYRIASIDGAKITTKCGIKVNRANAVYLPTPGEIRKRMDRFCKSE